FASFYLAVELLRPSAPFGGVSWVRLGWGQVDAPLAWLAAWGGPTLVTVAAATVGTSIAAVLFGATQVSTTESANASLFPDRGIRGVALIAALIPFGLTYLAHLGVNKPQHTTETLTVAAIQGNVPRLGDRKSTRLNSSHVSIS